ncbi:hypothetical protein MYRNA_76 [Mycobacterium phage Myrna]|uniref:Uncharacterized protein n=1 Tax=Mycobacterium phage Myrna TaxID=546805 RepID=B5LJ87_9CAUD|nr:gp76 [Mycobacterium phage Myrna]ACH62084.1 hypothetical protein MYRNA_76 [Mycobacterium phage Myrna]
MTAPTNIPAGFLGINLGDLDPGKLIGDLLPKPIAEAIRDVTNVIIDPKDDTYVEGQPQPEGERPIPTTDPQELNAAVKAIDAVTSAIAIVLKFGFIVPDDAEEILRKVSGALKTIRGWLD